MIHFRIRYEQLRAVLARRRHHVAALRAGWLSLIVLGVAAAAFAIGRLGPWPVLWPVAAASLFLAAWAAMARPQAPSELGEALDRLFALDDLLVTAVEVDERGPKSPLEVRLLDDAASALARIERDPRLIGPGVAREAEALIGMSAVVAGAWLLAVALSGATWIPGGGGLGANRIGGGFGPALPGLGLGDDPSDEGSAESAGSQVGDAGNAAEFIQPLLEGGEGSADGDAAGSDAGGETTAGLVPSGDLRVGTPAARLSASAVATLPAQGNGIGSGVAVPGALGQAGAAATGEDAGVAGGGGAAPGAPGGNGPTWEHRQAVRRYFERP